MKIVRFEKDKTISYGILEGDKVSKIDSSPYEEMKSSNEKFPLEDVKLLAPCEPSKVIAVGLNYVDHAKELKMQLPEEPILFLKPPSSVIGPDADIIYPEATQQVDYEAELGIVIKDEIRDIIEEEASAHILGFTCANDVTARDLQKKDGQWTRAKSFDTFAPIGPWMETEFDVTNLKVELLLNGKVCQSSSTANMVFNPHFLVSFTSSVMTLMPGDVIMTGTPSGVGSMHVGDTVEVRVENIGCLRNTVVAF